MRTRLERTGTFNYQVERSNEEWPDHQARQLVTSALIAWLTPDSVVDPACGDGSIVIGADRVRPIERVWLSDLSQPNVLKLVRDLDGSHPSWSISHVSIEQSLSMVLNYDLIVLTEILEHLEDPVLALKLARESGRKLIASSPEMRPYQTDGNPEHLWMFDGEGYEQMLVEGGWKPIHKTHLAFRTMYDFQIWVCE